MASLLFGLADKLTGELCSPLFRDYVEKHMEFGTQSEFEKLKNTVSAIKSVLLDAQEKERTNRQVRDWLMMVKLVFYDLEDLLQEVRTEDLKRRLKSKKRPKTVRIFFSISNQLKYRFKMGREVKLIRERLDAIASDRNLFSFTERREEMNAVGINRREETHSFVPIYQLIGRDADKECVIKHLLQSDVVDNVSVVSIVGIGGMGKTTLAQSVYNSEEVKMEFELRMWVCVSDPFDVKLICEKIIEAATHEKCERLSMDDVKYELKKAIGGRKYLLVLDDVWNESIFEWRNLEVLLSCGAEGSKILITARSELVARAAGSVATHVLKGLSNESSWALFKQIAFRQGVEQVNPTMKRIGKEVLVKCVGVPLVVKAMGSILALKEKEIDWLDFEKNDLPRVTQDREGMVLPILRLSYDYLPAPLKRCFVYCAIYPRDHEIEKEELIGMWVAHGFIHLDSTTRSLEDVGEQYFMDLLDRSFFEVHKRAFIGGTCYKMHDLIHDLAQSLGGDEYYNLELDANYIDKSTRHAWVSGDKLTNKWLDRKKLRTLVLTSSGDEQRFDELTGTFEQLRVLILRHLQLASVPQFVGGLRHLYYLDLSENHSRSLPESICSLYNLQTLVLSNCVNLKELLAGTINLVNLRRLDVSGCRKLRHMPRGLEELTCLQTLILSNCDNMEELPAGTRYLVNLRHLDVSGCPELRHMPSGLEELTCLQMLILSNCINLEELPAGTRDLVSLRHLDASGCSKLRRMPMGLEKLTCLEMLILSDCVNLEELPARTRNLVRLKHLDISGCRKLRHMPRGLEQLTCLQTLILSDCINLEKLPEGIRNLVSLRHLDVSGCPELRHMLSGLERLTCLHMLILSNCINLEELPEGIRYLVSLRHLDVSGCPELRHMLSGLERLTCLQMLILSNCINLEELPEGIRYLVSLRHLDASGCSKLRWMPMGLDKVTCLETLILSDCVNLEELPAGTRNLVSLKHLDVSGCPKLRHMPSGLEELTCLQTLILSNCINLEELPAETRDLVSLRRLDVSGSPKLRYMPRGLEEPTVLQTMNTFVTGGSKEEGGKRKCAELCDLESQEVSINHTLDLSYSNIKSLPEFISEYVAVRELKLKGCQLLMELGPEIGEFLNLEELDLEGTEIICLPKEIAKLINLKSLKFTLCGYADQFQETKQIASVIPQKALSNLLQLNELSIDVNPHGDWWNVEVKTVIDDLHCLQELKSLCLYIPTVDLFGYLIQQTELFLYEASVCFRFKVGHHDEERLTSRLPQKVLKEFHDLEKFKKGLKFTDGEGMPIEIKNALEHVDAFLLERHWSINNLLEFGLKTTEILKFCILSECNELQTVIDTKQYNDSGQPILGSLQHLSIHYMKSMRKIWRGPVTKGSLSNLKSLALYTCVSLTTVFKIDMLANLVNLEELRIEDCQEIKTLASSNFSDSISQDFLPKLKIMLLLQLPNLRCISSGRSMAPKLERLVILYCPNLRKLSTAEISSLQKLKGTKGWWDALKWYESDVTESDQKKLTLKFAPLTEDKDLETQFFKD